MKKIVLCADDFGQNASISQGILILANKGRLSATSCMVNAPQYASFASHLNAIRKKIDVGLHFNLTEGQALSSAWKKRYGKNLPSLKSLMRQSLLRGLDSQACYAELTAQLNYFIHCHNSLPDFIDGHQHIHHLPVIRQALLALYQTRLQNSKPYCRISANRWYQLMPLPKQAVIAYTGALLLKRACKELAVPHNTSFSGIYNFSANSNYSAHFQYFLAQIKNGGLIMCHPGLNSNDPADAIRAARENEYNYFLSDAFKQHLTNENSMPTRFKDISR